MPGTVDIIGKCFGKLVVIRRVDNSRHGKARWLCSCDCGKRTTVVGSDLRNGNTKSCGCLQKEITQRMGLKNIKHGYKGTHLYSIWCGMIQRCTYSKNISYPNYGGRGIKVCKRWRKSFINFLEDMGECPEGLQIERKNNNKGYYKSNCRWATLKEQNRNKRDNRWLFHNGKKQCLIDWSKETGISPPVILWRLKNGWSIKKTLTTPVRKYKKRRTNK